MVVLKERVFSYGRERVGVELGQKQLEVASHALLSHALQQGGRDLLQQHYRGLRYQVQLTFIYLYRYCLPPRSYLQATTYTITVNPVHIIAEQW